MSDFGIVDQYVDSLANRGQSYHTFDKTQLPTMVVGRQWSNWLATGYPGPGVAPTTAVVPTSVTAGALARFTNPTSGSTLHLHDIDARQGGSTTTTASLWDRLSHQGGLSGTAAGTQTTNLPTAAITRGDTTGIGVYGFVEIYSALGATNRSLTVTYTNQAGTGSRTGTVALGGGTAAAIGRLFLITLQAGDTGIRSIESCALSGTTGTTGNFGFTLARRIIPIAHIASSTAVLRAGLEIGSPVVEPNACLWLVHTMVSSGGSFGKINGGLTLVASG